MILEIQGMLLQVNGFMDQLGYCALHIVVLELVLCWRCCLGGIRLNLFGCTALSFACHLSFVWGIVGFNW
jgi:hypothetical protein